MLLSTISPKLTIVLFATLWFVAPALADARSDLTDRIDHLEQNVSRAQAEVQVAQGYNRPPGDVPGGGYGGAGQNAAALDVRVDRLENQMRTLNGQIEQIQFDIKRLDDALRKFQQDVDFRLQDNGRGTSAPAAPPRAGQRHSEIDEQAPPSSAVAAANPSVPKYGAPGPGTRASDAFNPVADPNAPGAPRAIGTVPANGDSQDDSPTIIAAPAGAGPQSLPQGPLRLDSRDPNAPLELASAPHPLPAQVPAATPPYSAPPSSAAQPLPSGFGANVPSGGTRVAPAGTQLASLPASTSRDDFEAASVALKGQQFETAETGFKTFLDKYPKDRLVPDAVFYLGESYFDRNRYREAAEQYLKISSDYSKAAKAPESLLRLGQSLDKLGAKEQACAAFAEVGRKYPSAAASVRATADRESKRGQC